MAASSTRSSNGGPPGIKTSGQAPFGAITPEEAARIRASVGGREQVPSTQAQATFVNWRQAADQLGSPFNVDVIPISRLRMMRRDPILAFGLTFIKTPHVRAKWFIDAKDKNGPNAQVAAHLDHDLRQIYPSYVPQRMTSLDFGFAGLGKRFQFQVPSGTYIATDPNTGEQSEQPIWSQGNIQPISWKPFVGLAPEFIDAKWDGQGGFNGISYDPSGGAGGGNITGGGAAAIQTGPQEQQKWDIDLYHSLWITNEKEENFGSIYGYPRLGYAYRYWWSYWFRWAISDRAFERKGDPSVLVKHPEGDFIDPATGTRTSYGDWALALGERIRSGGVIAMPSDVYEDISGKGTIPMWEVDTVKTNIDFVPFDESFSYIDIQKLRSLWIPEQALTEGAGGTSSRNVASEMQDSLTESQAVLSEEHRQQTNLYLIPQWLAVNYPDFVANGGTAELKIIGFAEQDVSFTQQIVQLIGQQAEGVQEMLKLVDLAKILDESGTPLRSFADQQVVSRRLEQQAQQASQAGPPAVNPVAGRQVGVVPSPTGFGNLYIQPGEVVVLSDSVSRFVESLPDSQHYSDSGVKSLSKQLWHVFYELYRDEILSASDEIGRMSVLEFSDNDDGIELADDISRANALLRHWKGSRLWGEALAKTRDILKRVVTRASKLELKKSNLNGVVDDGDIQAWIDSRIENMASKIRETTQNEVRDFVASQMQRGITDPKLISKAIRTHFDEFPQWKADRAARSEVRDAYNAATLLAAEAAGVNQVQAIDAQLGATDEICELRNGRMYSVKKAWNEQEHPFGTLAWRILPVNLSFEVFVPSKATRAKARYDDESHTVYFANSITDEEKNDYLKALAVKL